MFSSMIRADRPRGLRACFDILEATMMVCSGTNVPRLPELMADVL